MKPSDRRLSVATLGAAIEKAIERGDAPRAVSLTEQMVAIVLGTVDGYSPDQSVRAFQWCAAHDDGALDELTRKTLWRHPEIVVEMAKSIRRLAREGTDPKARREAIEALKRYGLDDDSLRESCEESQ